MTTLIVVGVGVAAFVLGYLIGTAVCFSEVEKLEMQVEVMKQFVAKLLSKQQQRQ
jgi:hypothetical protein